MSHVLWSHAGTQANPAFERLGRARWQRWRGGAGGGACGNENRRIFAICDRPRFLRTARHLSDVLGAPVDLMARRAILPEVRDDVLSQAVDVF